jgi:serine protease Do
MVLAQLKDRGYVTRGWLGVQIQPVAAEIADSLGMKKAQGAMVDEPQKGSPAATAGIEAGDVITVFNGTPVKDARDLARKVACWRRTWSATIRRLATLQGSPLHKGGVRPQRPETDSGRAFGKPLRRQYAQYRLSIHRGAQSRAKNVIVRGALKVQR